VQRDGRLYDRYWDGSSWHDWKPMDAPPGVRLVGQPAAAARDADRIDVFAPGDDGKVWHTWWNGTRWQAWQPVEGAPAGAGALAADWVGGRLDLYARDRDGALWYAAIER